MNKIWSLDKNNSLQLFDMEQPYRKIRRPCFTVVQHPSDGFQYLATVSAFKNRYPTIVIMHFQGSLVFIWNKTRRVIQAPLPNIARRGRI